MSKKIMLLALAVAALFALPSVASAQEAHISGVSNFTGSGGAGSLQATGEPTISCTASTNTGKFDTGSTTTGTITLDFTGCTATFFGIKANCNTSGGASGTIASSGTFHVITTNNKPGILVTPVATTIICAGFSNTTVEGKIIGTITSPACGVASKTITTVFTSSGSTQEDKSYTGVNYNLTAQTSGGSKVESGLTSGNVTLNSTTAGTVECT
jgi:hypothetical protein